MERRSSSGAFIGRATRVRPFRSAGRALLIFYRGTRNAREPPRVPESAHIALRRRVPGRRTMAEQLESVKDIEDNSPSLVCSNNGDNNNNNNIYIPAFGGPGCIGLGCVSPPCFVMLMNRHALEKRRSTEKTSTNSTQLNGGLRTRCQTTCRLVRFFLSSSFCE